MWEGERDGPRAELWLEVDALLSRADPMLDTRYRERDRAILAVLVVAERLGVDVKRARGIVLSSGVVERVPSEPTISRQRARLQDLLRRVQPSAPDRPADPAAALRRAVGVASYPAFCARMRREHGLLLDPVHLQRTLNPQHAHRASPGVAATVLRHLESRRRGRARRTPEQALTPTDAARRLADALAYEKRLPGEHGVLTQRLWRLTTGLPAEVDLLAEAMRAWIVRKTAQDPASLAWDAAVMFAAAWTEVTRAASLAARHVRTDPTALPPWGTLSATQRRAVVALAALPGRAWTADEIAALAGVAQADALDLTALTAGRWLAFAAEAAAPAYICTPVALGTPPRGRSSCPWRWTALCMPGAT